MHHMKKIVYSSILALAFVPISAFASTPSQLNQSTLSAGTLLSNNQHCLGSGYTGDSTGVTFKYTSASTTHIVSSYTLMAMSGSCGGSGTTLMTPTARYLDIATGTHYLFIPFNNYGTEYTYSFISSKNYLSWWCNVGSGGCPEQPIQWQVFSNGTNPYFRTDLTKEQVDVMNGNLANGIDEEDFTTHIISLTPENNTTETDNNVTFSLTAYLNENDINPSEFLRLKIYLHNIDKNVIWGTRWLSPSDIVLYEELATTSGMFSFSTTTVIADGNYTIQAVLERTMFGIDGLNYDKQSNQFIVNESTYIGNISQNLSDTLDSFYASSSATSTSGYANTCSPIRSDPTWGIGINENYSIINCAAFLFIPDNSQINDTIQTLHDEILVRFPIGYLTDFYNIMSTTTTGSLVLLTGTIPAILPDGGEEFTLDATHQLDFLLNATSGIYSTATENDNRTFYEITNDYWEIFLYIATFFYILNRVSGSMNVPPITTTRISQKYSDYKGKQAWKKSKHNPDNV